MTLLYLLDVDRIHRIDRTHDVGLIDPDPVKRRRGLFHGGARANRQPRLLVVRIDPWTSRILCRARNSTGAATDAERTPHHLQLDSNHISNIIGCMIDVLHKRETISYRIRPS